MDLSLALSRGEGRFVLSYGSMVEGRFVHLCGLSLALSREREGFVCLCGLCG
jgi:hypothetical protein